MIIKNVLNYSAYFLHCLAIAEKAVMHSRWLVWKCDDALSHLNWICHVIACVAHTWPWWLEHCYASTPLMTKPFDQKRSFCFSGGGRYVCHCTIHMHFLCVFRGRKANSLIQWAVSLHLTACFNCTPQVLVDPFPCIHKRMHTTDRLPVVMSVCVCMWCGPWGLNGCTRIYGVSVALGCWRYGLILMQIVPS